MMPRALFIALLLTGCTMAPKYERPAMPVQDAWPQGEAYKAPPPSNSISDYKAIGPDGKPVAVAATPAVSAVQAKDLNWASFFQSEPMKQVIQSAVANNKDLKIAALNIEAARAQYRIQRADLLPTVEVTGSISRTGIPENGGMFGGAGGGGSTFNQSALNVGITSFELDLFGRIRSLNEAALQQYLATEEARNAVQVSLIAETANAYLAYLADRKLLEITNQTLATQEQAHELIKKRFELGVGTQQDVAQAATAVETARANQAVYTRAMAQDKNALEMLVGGKLDDALLNQVTIDTVQVMDNLPVGLPSETLLARPDIKQAELLLKSANANIGAARAAFFPRISLTAAIGLASGDLDKLFDNGSRTAWNFAPQASIPIFTGGRITGGLAAVEAQRDIAVTSYERAIQNAFREVADELAARGTFTDQLKAQQALVGATQQAYDIAQARYQQGIDSHLGVLDAQRSLYASQQNEILVKRQRLSNLVNLYKALGGGQTQN